MAGSALPDGNVTFLFTDIEGSTRLIEKLGEEGYVEALAVHRCALRDAFVVHGGVEVDTQGDAFLFVFADPVEALVAAAEGQAALGSGPVRVRMGLHTGEVRLTGEGYAGRELHRAARVGASGHGGQVVLSAATRALVDGELTELGEHRLKDFEEPVGLFQLGSSRFPPLKTISNTNLPRPASSFVGRERERDELVGMLSNGRRLVTLSGPGGSGKTRLAVEAAAELVSEFKAGVFWVGLSALRDPTLVGATIGQTLGAKDGLAEHVGERELLLLLDNFEQVVEAAPELGELLESCPNLKLLVTSRERLRIRGEVDYPVPPLAGPEAVELFCERAQLEPDETIAELCRRLEELPLALELAAARTSVLSPAQILERLSQRLDLLKAGRDAEARQQTLRATIDWSHDLLSEDEQRLFARLAVFRGGCTLEAAERVADADLDTLQSLVDKSLLRHTNERFWMLETIREYARGRLAKSGEEQELRRRHAGCALAIAEAAYYPMKEEGADQADALGRIGAEHDNLRAALEWARDEREDETLLRLAASLSFFWFARAFVQEAATWITLAVERGSEPVQARFTVLQVLSAMERDRGDIEAADALVAEQRSIAEREANEGMLLNVLNSEGWAAQLKGDLDAARAAFLALTETARELGKPGGVGIGTVNIATIANEVGDFQGALDYSTEALALFREVGDDSGVIVALLNCGLNALELEDRVIAEQSFREALAVSVRVGMTRHALPSAAGLASALVAVDEVEKAACLLGAVAALQEGTGFELDEELKEHCARALSDARASLGEEAFDAAWARGKAMTPEEIVAFTMAS